MRHRSRRKWRKRWPQELHEVLHDLMIWREMFHFTEMCTFSLERCNSRSATHHDDDIHGDEALGVRISTKRREECCRVTTPCCLV